MVPVDSPRPEPGSGERDSVVLSDGAGWTGSINCRTPLDTVEEHWGQASQLHKM